jgi:hypothetical protein
MPVRISPRDHLTEQVLSCPRLFLGSRVTRFDKFYKGSLKIYTMVAKNVKVLFSQKQLCTKFDNIVLGYILGAF